MLQEDPAGDFALDVVSEYPKMDVREWRKKRDIQLLGRILHEVLDHIDGVQSSGHLATHCIYKADQVTVELEYNGTHSTTNID